MEIDLRREALACIDNDLREVQVVIVALTRQLTLKIAEQLINDGGGGGGDVNCLPCINDRRIDEHFVQIQRRTYRIVVGTLGRINLFFFRNLIRPQFVKKLFILDSIAMVSYPMKRTLERVLGFIQANIHICLHLPSSSSITRQISDFHEKTSYYGIHPGLIEANHFAVVVTDESQKMDKLCDLCRTNITAPILICCTMNGTAFANAKILRAQNLPVLIVTSEMSSYNIRIAIEKFQSCEVCIMVTTGYIRGLIDLAAPMIIINYNLPKPDAYARRVNFTDESWIARNTVFISLITMNERNKLDGLKESLGLRWILMYPGSFKNGQTILVPPILINNYENFIPYLPLELSFLGYGLFQLIV